MNDRSLALRTGDFDAALAIVRSTDIAVLMLRKEQLQSALRQLRPQLQYEYNKPATLTEEARQLQIQECQQKIVRTQAQLENLAKVTLVWEKFYTKLPEGLREALDTEFSTYRTRGQSFVDRQRNLELDIKRANEKLAAYGEPEPEWVDPRIETANRIATLEAALDQVNADLKAAKKALVTK